MCDALMAVRREAERDRRERLAAFGRELGWEGDGEVGALEEVLLLGEEVVENVGERRVGGAEAGGEEILQRAGDLVGYDGGGGGPSDFGDVDDGGIDWFGRAGTVGTRPRVGIRVSHDAGEAKPSLTTLTLGRMVAQHKNPSSAPQTLRRHKMRLIERTPGALRRPRILELR